MRTFHRSLFFIAAATLAASAAHADVRITEVAPWSSGNSPVGADWFELTNTGTSAVSLAGWTMDDSSATAGSAALGGISSIAAGESVIFIEGNGSQAASFRSTWFGANAPAGLQIGYYSGSGVGLSTDGDGVYVFDASKVKHAFVTFGTSASGPYATFDNAAGINGVISQLSAVGVNGAFAAAGDAMEIGSPGSIAAAVPEPATIAMMLAGLGLVAGVATRRR